MSETKLLYCVRPDVTEYLRACEALLKKSRETPLTPLEQEVVLLYTRKLVEAFL
jgi:hypothetical protein